MGLDFILEEDMQRIVSTFVVKMLALLSVLAADQMELQLASCDSVGGVVGTAHYLLVHY